MNISNWIITDAQGNVLQAGVDSLDLGASGLNEILQNVRVICTTRVGTVQLDRLFGISFSYVDAPMNWAEQMIARDVCAALTHFEPRVTFKRIQFMPNIGNLVGLELDIKLSISIDASNLTAPNR
jgi:uncharacterized protein